MSCRFLLLLEEGIGNKSGQGDVPLQQQGQFPIYGGVIAGEGALAESLEKVGGVATKRFFAQFLVLCPGRGEFLDTSWNTETEDEIAGVVAEKGKGVAPVVIPGSFHAFDKTALAQFAQEGVADRTEKFFPGNLFAGMRL